MDGEDISNIDRDHYRQGVVLVSQEPKLFNLSISDNITYGLFEHKPSKASVPRRACFTPFK